MSLLKLAGIIRESIVDGPGIRFVVFAQGCPHGCPGCHNPQTWKFEGGAETAPQKIILEMAKNPLLRGLTLSGGEPFCQPGAMAELAQRAKQKGYDVIAYTGYTFEKLLKKSRSVPDINALLHTIDVLIDGPFVQALKSYDLQFMGSSNQRVLDVRESLLRGMAVAAKL